MRCGDETSVSSRLQGCAIVPRCVTRGLERAGGNGRVCCSRERVAEPAETPLRSRGRPDLREPT
eukprot:522146-Rhodomonas_salina.2